MPDWQQVWFEFIHLSVAFVLTAIIGWNRERESHNTGIRAFPIVGIASCAYLMVTHNGIHADTVASSRVLQGLITGIGFVGGGAIVKEGITTHGTATAAAVWCAGAIGAAVATDHWTIAVMLTALNLAALRGLTPLKVKLGTDPKSVKHDS